MMIDFTDFVFDAQSATVFGQTVKRPARIAPSQWMAFWEDVIYIKELKRRISTQELLT
jgi:hypothetical protein